MPYADTKPVTLSNAWGLVGTSPLSFTNTTDFSAQIFRKASGSPAAADVGVPLDAGARYTNSAQGEVVYARLLPDSRGAGPVRVVAVDEWA